MKKLYTSMAAMALAVMLITAPTTQAKADGGALAIGIGAFLLVDAIVGRHCAVDDWPFNLVHSVSHHNCHHRHYRRHHHHRWHHRHHRHHHHHHYRQHRHHHQ